MVLEFSIHEMTIAVKDINAAQDRFAGSLQGTPDEIQNFPQDSFELNMGGV